MPSAPSEPSTKTAAATTTTTTTTPTMQSQLHQPQASRQAQQTPLNPILSPLPLSASQEAQVRDLYYKRVRAKCADEVRDFAACATNRTFTATFLCRREQKAMNNCMMRFATQAEQDAARAEWFATMADRREERERKEEKRKKDEVFWREWWDKDRTKLSASTSAADGTTDGDGAAREKRR